MADTPNDMAIDNPIQRTEAVQNRIQSFAFVIAVGVCVLLSIWLVVSNLTGFEKSYEIRLESRINPNSAPVASLVRLPGIGLTRAEAIVAYREGFSERNGGIAAFQNGDDLQKVKGIGPKTAQNINQWLKFEQE